MLWLLLLNFHANKQFGESFRSGASEMVLGKHVLLVWSLAHGTKEKCHHFASISHSRCQAFWLVQKIAFTNLGNQTDTRPHRKCARPESSAEHTDICYVMLWYGKKNREIKRTEFIWIVCADYSELIALASFYSLYVLWTDYGQGQMELIWVNSGIFFLFISATLLFETRQKRKFHYNASVCVSERVSEHVVRCCYCSSPFLCRRWITFEWDKVE